MITIENRYTTRSRKRVIIEFIDEKFVHGIIKRAANGLDKKAIWYKETGRFVGKTIDYPLSLIEEVLLIPESFKVIDLGITNSNRFEIT